MKHPANFTLNMLGGWVLLQEVAQAATSSGGIMLSTRDKTEPDMGRVFARGPDAIIDVHPHDVVLLQPKCKRHPINIDRDLGFPMPGLFVVHVNDITVVLDRLGPIGDTINIS